MPTSRTEQRVENVRSRAYELYLERCRAAAPGDALTDWATAEREMECSVEYRGRAQARRGSHAETVTDEHGYDVENPT